MICQPQKFSRSKPLPLSNDGVLSLYSIGCGSAFSKTLYQNNWLIVKGDDHLMIDCGTRTPQAFYELGRSVTDISNWVITHSHADHIGGLEEVMLMGRYFVHRKPTVLITEEYQKSLWEKSLRGGSEYNEIQNGKGLDFEDFWKVLRPTKLANYPRETCQAKIGSIDIKLVRTRHYPEQSDGWKDAFYSVGLVIDDRILFTSDTQFDLELLTTYDERFNFECIFHDVQFFTGGIHASLDEMVTLPIELKRKMILMHYQESYRTHEKRVQQEGFIGFAQQGACYLFD